MSHNPRFGEVAINAETQAVIELLDGGFLRIYDGRQPESPDVKPNRQRMLVELRWGEPAFDEPTAGTSAAYAIQPANALMTGQASWFRASSVDGAAVFDGSCGDSEDFDLVIDAANIQAGAQVSVASFSYTNPRR